MTKYLKRKTFFKNKNNGLSTIIGKTVHSKVTITNKGFEIIPYLDTLNYHLPDKYLPLPFWDSRKGNEQKNPREKLSKALSDNNADSFNN